MSKQEQNQKEGEFFALVATGRRGVEDMLAKMGDEIRAVACPSVNRDFGTWTKRAFLEIVNSDELAPALQTRKGIFSLYKEMVRAATMGVQIGGEFPQGYFVREGDEVKFVPDQRGYAHVAAFGPGAVLEYAPELVRVYESDTFALDQAAGEIKVHEFDPRKDRGKLAGWYMRLKYRDGHVETPFVTAAKAQAISDAYSKKKKRDGGMMPSWAKSPDEMLDKTAAKHLLKRPAAISEGLAMALTAEDGDEPASEPQPMRDVTERTVARLERAAETVGPGTSPEPETSSAAQPAETSAAQKPAESSAAKPAAAEAKELF